VPVLIHILLLVKGEILEAWEGADGWEGLRRQQNVEMGSGRREFREERISGWRLRSSRWEPEPLMEPKVAFHKQALITTIYDN